ncbi:MAG TPA: hypothetical protein VK633_00290, partial [Verrucomicrobiae bacterium]|nr:hypothetical protein [Verrucomicrobiae bacterium]
SSDRQEHVRGMDLLIRAAYSEVAEAQYELASLLQWTSEATGKPADQFHWYWAAHINGVEAATAKLRTGIPYAAHSDESLQVVNGKATSAKANFETGTVRLAGTRLFFRGRFDGSIIVRSQAGHPVQLISGMTKSQIGKIAEANEFNISKTGENEWSVGDTVLFFAQDRLVEVEQSRSVPAKPAVGP